MCSNLRLRRSISKIKGSYALFSYGSQPVTTAVIFVHGFMGSAQTTFKDFQTLVSEDPHATDWTSCDLYFFHYESVTDSISTSSERLVAFMNSVYPQPPEELLTVKRSLLPWSTTLDAISISDVDRNYNSLILGHSEGDVVIR